MKNHNSTNTLHAGAPLSGATAAVILIHGRGSSGTDIVQLADAMPSERIAFLAPTAEGGMWYPQRFFVPLEQNEPALSAALNTIDSLRGEINQAGIADARIGLVGFSQGACLALEYAARRPNRYALVAALSGALIGPSETRRGSADLKGTPVLLGCAESDAHIPLRYVEQSAATLESFGAALTKQIFPGSAHTVFPQEIAWLRERIAAL